MTHTFSRLGTWGALGNQLFEIAGTYGISKGDCVFPRWDFFPYFSVPEHLFSDVVDPNTIDLYPDYLQDLKHWYPNYQEQIHDFFQPSEMARKWIDDRYPFDLSYFTAVHIRRANNLALPDHHPVCGLEYFERALDHLPEKKPLMVFSDDLNWCRQQELFKDALFAEGNPDDTDIWQLTGAKPLSLPSVALDLLTMARCSQHVISNSTFSWWGAWLAISKAVIYPTQWFGPALSHIDTSVMFPGDWIEVER